VVTLLRVRVDVIVGCARLAERVWLVGIGVEDLVILLAVEQVRLSTVDDGVAGRGSPPFPVAAWARRL